MEEILNRLIQENRFIHLFINSRFFIVSAASEALTDMPPRLEEELDPVTLHNQALISMDTNPSDGNFVLLASF